MPEKRNWTRDELLLAMNLYCTLPFGQLDHRTPEIVRLAHAIGRTPSSVAMKLCNLASLDPVHHARGVKGLVGASRADREIWEAFHSDWEQMGAESEEMRQQLIALPTGAADPPLPGTPPERNITMPVGVPFGPDEGEGIARVRYSQRFFRRSVLAAYSVRCCITGNPVPQLLVASHILPWSAFPEHRANPSNGLCLSRIHDAAFDQGLITLDADYHLVLSDYLRTFLPDDAVDTEFVAYEGKQIQFPDKFLPDLQFLDHHRSDIFLA